MESVAKVIPVESTATRDGSAPEYTEDMAEQENCAESCQHDSEYNTASDSTTSDAGIEKISKRKIEVIEISDDEEHDEEEDGPEDEDDDRDDGSSVSEDGEEEEDPENADEMGQLQETKRQVDDDEDRSNPQYIPKRGTFYEHDDRTAENADGEPQAPQNESEIQEKKVSFNAPPPVAAKAPKKWQQSGGDRWSHDRYDESEQAPKSKAELVSAYGYDIRNEESPPRARRRRRYGRGPSKYTRKWEDENAYSKPTSRRIAINSKDEFPEIEENNSMGRSGKRRSERKNVNMEEPQEFYGNRPSYGDGGGGSHENNQLKPRNQPSSGYRVKSSIEFKNQNRLRQSSNIEHNRTDSFVITRNNNVPGGQIEGGLEGQMLERMDEQQQHSRSGDYKPQHHQQQQQQQVHSLNGNEFTEFVPNYLHNQMNQEQQHAIHHSQMAAAAAAQQQNMMLSRDLQLNYGNDSVKMLQQQQQQSVRGHQATNVSGNLIGMSVGDTNMRQTPKRYSSLRQRAVMSNNAQQQQQLMPEIEERLKKKYDQMPGQSGAGGMGQEQQQHHEIVDSPKMKMRQPKSLPPPQQQTLPATAQQPPILSQSTPQTTNYYTAAPEYIRQQPMSAHRPAPQATAKNHASLPGQAYQTQFGATNPAPPFVPPPAQTTPAFIAPPPPPQSTNPQQMINYVPSPTMPPPPAQPQYPPYPNYQNFITGRIKDDHLIPHQSQGGITYYAPQSQPPPRPVVSQRRPTNAIPILAPPERTGNGKGRGRLPAGSQAAGDDSDPNSEGKNNTENIDHILDNMFVRRTPYEQPSLKPSTSPPVSPVTVKGGGSDSNTTGGGGVDQVEETMKNLSVVSSDQQQLSAVAETPASSVRTDETAPGGGSQQEVVQEDK